MSSAVPPTNQPEAISFRPGQIVQLEVWNFMSAEHYKTKFGSEMNSSYGFSGTGKSQMINAIYFGLGGENLQLPITEYIRHGQSQFSIEITMKNVDSEPDLLIRRTTILEGSLTSWMIDGEPRTIDRVRSLTNRFHINLESKLDFMFGSRKEEVLEVISSPKSLLLLAEQTTSMLGLYEYHLALLELEKKSEEVLQKVQDATNQAEICLQELADTEGTVEYNNNNNKRSAFLESSAVWNENFREWLRIQERLNKKSTIWTKKIAHLASEISQVFQKSLLYFGYGGKIEFQRSGPIKDWGFVLYVSFPGRHGLIAVDNQTHSSSERYLAMYLFAMSLHLHTDSPIRIFEEVCKFADGKLGKKMHEFCEEIGRQRGNVQCFYTPSRLYCNLRESSRTSYIYAILVSSSEAAVCSSSEDGFIT